MIKYAILLIPFAALSQSYAPEPGVVGSTAIYKDSSVFVTWASGIEITRGPQFIENVGFGYASYGSDVNGLGPADGASFVSLGDGGEAVLTFSAPINNGPGFDFAVFENGFIDHYLELAFVEVSSDGINFTRFPAISEIQTDTQLSNFDTVNCGYVYNFAGKYRVNYGTPFDLEELSGTPGLDINAITHVKLIDVVGTINPLYGTFDSQNTIINDPYPTMFESGGFDLDAVGVIHSQELAIPSLENQFVVGPNPASNQIVIKGTIPFDYTVSNVNGQLLLQGNENTIDITTLNSGVYYLRIQTAQGIIVKSIVKN